MSGDVRSMLERVDPEAANDAMAESMDMLDKHLIGDGWENTDEFTNPDDSVTYVYRRGTFAITLHIWEEENDEA